MYQAYDIIDLSHFSLFGRVVGNYITLSKEIVISTLRLSLVCLTDTYLPACLLCNAKSDVILHFAVNLTHCPIFFFTCGWSILWCSIYYFYIQPVSTGACAVLTTLNHK